MIKTKSIDEFKRLIKKNKSFLILTHVNPEPDTIGSALSLYHYIKGTGKNVKVYNEDDLPKFMKFMKYSSVISTVMPAMRFDVAICVDAGSPDMLGGEFNRLKSSFFVNIDHHRTNTMYGDLNIVDPCASATCELIYDLFKKIGADIDITIASLLLTGIIYDTGSFRYRNTTYNTLKISSELVRSGADIAGITEKLYENQSLERLKLLEMILNTLELSSDGKIASVELSKNMYEATGTSREDAEGMIDYPKSISGVIVAVLFREIEDGRYKVSLRSKSDFNVSDIAEELGGGGHKNAAGCTMEGRLFDVKNKVFSKIVERLK